MINEQHQYNDMWTKYTQVAKPSLTNSCNTDILFVDICIAIDHQAFDRRVTFIEIKHRMNA